VDEILPGGETPASRDGREYLDSVREQQHSSAASSARHSARAYWHFDPGWSVTPESPGRLHAIHVDGASAWLLHDTGHACLAHGDEQSGLGWFAPVYGTLRPAWSAEIAHQATAPFALVTWIGAVIGDGMPALERLAVGSDSDHAAIAARVTAGDRTSVFLIRPGRTLSTDASGVVILDHRTDARVLHYHTGPNRSIVLDLVDARYALAQEDGWLSLEADAPFADLHVGVADEVLDLRASDPPQRLRLRGRTLSALRRFRLNGRQVDLSPAPDGSLAIERPQWTQADRVVRLAHSTLA